MRTAHLVPNEETIKNGEDDAFSLVSYFDNCMLLWFVYSYKAFVYVSELIGYLKFCHKIVATILIV